MSANTKIDPARAWAPYEPDSRRPWDLRRAGHLYRRAAFGATWDQLQQALADGPQRTIDKLLRPGSEAAAFDRAYDRHEVSDIDPDAGSSDGLRQWWLRRMMETPYPLLEKMTLFWHQHFGASGARVQQARLMQRYLSHLRSHALGRFAPLAEAVVCDPATALSLDLGPNFKALPSESLARALLEHFTVGPGAYSARDLRETARALTGWSVLKRQLRYLEHQHDTGVKTVFGQEGNFGAADVVRIALAQPATPRRLVRKLYRWLISEADEPGDELIGPLAESLAKEYDVAKVVETMLRCNLFFSPAAYRRRIKSPVEFAISIVRPLEAIVPTAPLGHDLAALGQDLCEPPTIKGWAGGRTWITASTLVARGNLAVSLFGGGEPYGNKLDPAALAKRHGHESLDAAGAFLVDLLLQGDVEAGVRQSLFKPPAGKPQDSAPWLRQLTHTIVTLPEFQLA